ncbi:type I polyketide synthase [Pseudomonas sp. S31]|uniref:hypothetical protein n=1 Tax=Pseudomonas sp. S31 TaxID=1564473 RepID=UPI00191323C2|nr:hypothetical protein [Pseudomonas sp. S31]MBK5000604.1 type I polyketide synthase [Pseudomonas sp. S31]
MTNGTGPVVLAVTAAKAKRSPLAAISCRSLSYTLYSDPGGNQSQPRKGAFFMLSWPARRPEDGRCTATLIKSRAFADL